MDLVRRNSARFAAIGATGILVNQLVLWALTDVAGIHYLVSAVLASQASTLWNFVLVERFVFPGRHAGRARATRFLKFWAVNMSTFLVRGPALILAVDVLRIHYLISNFVILVGLFVARYLLADRWIWRTPVAPLARAEWDLDDELNQW
jgi:dolichol-phosphate mannosyltransferase